MKGHVELLAHRSLGVSQQRKRQVAERGLESRQFFSRPRADSDNGATHGSEQIVLFLEGQATSLAGRRIVAGIEEHNAPRPVERVAVKDLAFFVFKSETWRLLADDVDFHVQASVGEDVAHPGPFGLHVVAVLGALADDDGDPIGYLDTMVHELVPLIGIVGGQFHG